MLISGWFLGISLLTIIATLDMELSSNFHIFGKFSLDGEDFILSMYVLGYLSSSLTINKLRKQPFFSVAVF